MSDQVDLGMPSPKRMRLEAAKPESGCNSPSPIDDINDLYDTPPIHTETPQTQSKNLFSLLEKHPPPATPKLFHLPGLSLLKEDPIILHKDLDQNIEKSGGLDSRSTEFKENDDIQEMGQEVGLTPNGDVASQHLDIAPLEAEPPFENQPPPETVPLVEGRNFPEESPCPGPVHTDEEPLAFITTAESVETQAEKSDGEKIAVVDDNHLNKRLQEAVFDRLEVSPQTKDLKSYLHVSEDLPAYSDLNDGIREETQHENSAARDASAGNKETVIESEILNGELEKEAFDAPTFEALAKGNKSDEGAEFEMDSSPYESSNSSESSTDISSSDDSDDDSDVEDYEMLSPEEEARRLMAEDGGTDNKGTDVPRTINEKPDEIVPKPEVTITEDMKLEELGRVEQLVENLALIKATISGEYQVLESGSVLCLENRTVIGAVAETLGRVQQPYYSVRFTNSSAMIEAGIVQNTRIFYVSEFARTVFTQPLKAYKGSDASNLHDEEIGDDELEFSDDEAEAEHKRQVKLQKRARYDAKHGGGDSQSRGPHQIPRKPAPRAYKPMESWPERPPNSAEPSLNYDDAAEVSDGLYTPLSRPSNLHEMTAHEDRPVGFNANQSNPQRGGRGRGRGDRGRGGGRHRGNRGAGRGGSNNGNSQMTSFGNPESSTNQNPNQTYSPRSRSSNTRLSGNDFPPQTFPQGGNPSFQPQPQQSPSLPAPPPSHNYSSPSYPSQYPPSNGQHYPQQPQNPYSHQNQYSQQQQSFPQYPYQQTPQMPPSPAAIPPGAHINPNFFRQQSQNYGQQSWNQWAG